MVFTQDPDVVDVAAHFLRLISFNFAASGAGVHLLRHFPGTRPHLARARRTSSRVADVHAAGDLALDAAGAARSITSGTCRSRACGCRPCSACTCCIGRCASGWHEKEEIRGVRPLFDRRMSVLGDNNLNAHVDSYYQSDTIGAFGMSPAFNVDLDSFQIWNKKGDAHLFPSVLRRKGERHLL